MANGRVTAFYADRGFGFIAPDDRGADVADLFVHVKDVANADELRRGDRVTFGIVNNARRGKKRAAEVRVI